MKAGWAAVCGMTVLLLLGALAGTWVAAPGPTERVSVASSGAQANGLSDHPSVSADGRFVAFEGANASNLVPNDTNGVADVFVRDRQLGTTERVSVDSAGGQSNNGSAFAAISADGRFVAFQSIASNLVPGDTNNQIDVFVHDRQTGTTTRASVKSDGNQVGGGGGVPAISADGRYVAFMSPDPGFVAGDTNGTWDIFVHDQQTGTTTRASVNSAGTGANDISTSPALSGDGRFVAFVSAASNLVGNDTNGVPDMFVRDQQTGVTERVSVNSSGAEGNGPSGAVGADHHSYLSAAGRFVAFSSKASNLVAGDTNSAADVFVRDRQLGTTERVSVDSAGSQSNGDSFFPALSADGRFVTFGSVASNLVAGDNNGVADVFVHDRRTGITSRVSVASDGTEGNGPSAQGDGGFEPPAISGDGRVVGFASFASNLVAGDTNATADTFVDVVGRMCTIGDVDGDGTVSSIDAALVLQYGAGLLGSLPCQSSADVNGDGHIDAIDAVLILQFSAGLLPHFV